MTDAPSRAGRNLPAAIGSGVGLGVVVLASLFTWKWLFAVVVIAAMLIAVHEFVNAFAQRDIKVARTPLLLSAILLPASAYLYGLSVEVVLLGIAVLFVLFWRIRREIGRAHV